MQKPVRYYITQSDDQAVVRTIPVTVQPTEIAPTLPPTPEAQAVTAQPGHTHGQARVGRLVRAAVRRDRDHR